MKRLIIAGFPCPKDAWEKLFPSIEGIEQMILPFYDVISQTDNAYYFFDLVDPVKKAIESYKPDLIVMHDFGVILGILAILKIKKINNEFNPKVVIFNGAFRGFNVLKATHPIRIQFMSYDSFQKEVLEQGGEVDPRFKEKFSTVKHVYRQVIVGSLLSLMSSIFKKKPTKKIDLGSEVLILASKNDPYIPFCCLQNIENDFNNTSLKRIDYGHFPYSGNIEEIKKQLLDFQLSSIHNSSTPRSNN